ncbi:ThuA domain-containing protein [Oceanitalea stevensii]|uniref:ThuA domain-containing protein n=1 Tax=Oceanitalea stevensii TaxID=2763072 RepID=UPI002044D6B3|nr:ThuA domain-containing protein [Oceanitalea stevensii]
MVNRPTGSRGWARAAGAVLASTLVLPLAVSGASADVEPPPDDSEFSALVFSKTAGFRHGSIEEGVAAIQQLGADNGFTVEHTEDAADFTEENLADYDVVVWLSTTGDVLDDAQQAAFEQYIQGGGGYAGIHAASDTEYDWAWYGELVGAYFAGHPPGTPDGTVDVADRVHPSTAHLPFEWDRTDEWYSYEPNVRGEVHVLATLDETSYEPGDLAMGSDHPIAWCHDYDGGRSWYTGGGHTEASFAEPAFLEHILGGIRTAAGVEDANCAATVASSYQKVTLVQGEENVGEPMALAVLPNGDVLHTARDGRIFYTNGDGGTRLAATVPVYSHDEDGMQGIAIDPDFEENRWVYAYYAPPVDTPPGDAPEWGTAEEIAAFDGYNRLSRFQLTEEGVLDLESEEEILRVEASRGTCCHAGGEIDFDAEGNLYLSTGDDTNPFASEGYTPIDEREGRNPAWDAQRSSANTNDLRGKLLRVNVLDEIPEGAEPGPGSTYEIPEGNLFAPGTELTRPEIYGMGFRNPFRFAVDKETGWVHLGDYGPDAGAANPNRGPGGQVEFNLIKEPGNYGWPYCHGDNDAYIDYEFPPQGEPAGSGESGEAFDCDNPVNESPNNTGLTELPPVIPAWLPYDGGSVPDLGNGSESPMGGPTYHYDPELDSDRKWPEYWDGKTLNYEWGRDWIREFVIDDDGGLVDIVPSLDWLEPSTPMAVEFGPDGALYVLDYGSGGFFSGAWDSAVYRVDYVADSPNPVARITTSTNNGQPPLTVEFDGSGSTDPQEMPLSYAWDFDNDGEIDSTEPTASFTYETAGVFIARLTVSAGEGEELRTGTITTNVIVGNTAPEVTLELPVDGGIFSFGDEVPFRVTVTDPEDGEIDCSRVRVEYILGHDEHGHPLSSATGCEGTITTPRDEGHGLDANVFGVINASYTDLGAEGLPALSADDEAMLRLRHQQAEFFTESEGGEVVDREGANGGSAAGELGDGDWISFAPMDLTNIDEVSLRYTSTGDGTVELRKGAVDGELMATVELGTTDGWTDSATADVTPVGGPDPVYFVVTGDAAVEIDEIHFHGQGMSAEDPDPGMVEIPVDRVSVQMFSLIPWVNEAGLPSVLARLAEIGLENIEPYGGNFAGYTAEEFRAMTDLVGLDVPSSHYNTDVATFPQTLEYVETLGQEYVGSGGFAAPGISSYGRVLETARTMNLLGRASVEADIGKFFGHNHATEFTTVYEHGGEEMSAWEILVEETDPRYVTFQLDVAWATHAGVDVPALIEEYGDRIELLHIKDATGLGEEDGPNFTNLGEGDVPLQDILAAAEEHAEIAYYVMEYDVAPEGEEFVETGFEYLTGLDAGEEGSRPVEVTPAPVTFTDEYGTADDTFTVPRSTGVVYLVDGEVVAPGTYPGAGTVTVTAQAAEGFVLADGAATEWTHTFSTAGPPAPDRRTAEFHLSNSWRGTTDVHFMYGRMADEVFIGDWDGDGEDTIAVRRGNVFHVSNAQRGGDADAVFTYGRPGDVILAGDWDGDGRDTFAVRRGAEYHVKNTLRGGPADVAFTYGRADDQVLVGDWDGNGNDTLAIRRGAAYYVKNSVIGGDADVVFTYGRAADVTLAGDWDGDGVDTFAIQRGRVFHVNNSLRGGDADRVLTFGRLGDEVYVGDWNGDGTDTLGIRRPVGGAASTAAKGIGSVSKAIS